eukprot:gene30837-35876_t
MLEAKVVPAGQHAPRVKSSSSQEYSKILQLMSHQSSRHTPLRLPRNNYDYRHPEQVEADKLVERAKEEFHRVAEEKLSILRYMGVRGPIDFGPDEIFLTLAGRCHTESGPVFSYEVCFFENAAQISQQNIKTSLGSWSGFQDGYSAATFTNGEPCGDQHPDRSLLVQFECGTEDRLHGSSEASTCVYEIIFATPLACTSAHVQERLDQLQVLEDFIKTVQAEIDSSASASREHLSSLAGHPHVEL